MKNQNIAGVQRHAPLVVADFLKNPEWKSRERNLVAPPILVEQRLRLPRICHAQFAAAPLPRRETRGHKAPLDAPLADDLVHLLELFRWLTFLRSKTPHNADRHGAIERRGSSLPADVAQRDPQLLRPIAQEFVQIAAHFPSRKITRGNVQAKILGWHGPQERALNTLRGL